MMIHAKMDFEGVLCLLAFFITLRFIVFGFFRPVCSRYQMDQSKYIYFVIFLLFIL